MNNTFSFRQGYKKSEILSPDFLPETAKNLIWNSIKAFYDGYAYRSTIAYQIIPMIWEKFFKRDLDELGNIRHSRHTIENIKPLYKTLHWYEIYDLIEFILNDLRNSGFYAIEGHIENFKDRLEEILNEEMLPYKIIDYRIVPLTSQTEAEEVGRALTKTGVYDSFKNHIQKALDSFSKRPDPDYLNSIKESVHSIEFLARELTGNKKAVLSDLVNKLDLHQAFKEGLKKFYGWSSDESGIRHSETGDPIKIGEEEARLLLILASSIGNYLISKNKL